jgi:hypothetical protein
MRKLLLLPFLILFVSNNYAQNTGRISGVLADSTDRTALQYATVSIYKAGDSILSAYTLTDVKGEFSFARLSLDQRYSDSVKTERTTFPFGPAMLVNTKFPDYWVHDDSSRTYFKNVSDSIVQYYHRLNTNNTHVKDLALGGLLIEVVKSTGSSYEDDSVVFNRALITAVSNLKYRLPDIGPYQCYYAYNESAERPGFPSDKNGKRNETYEETPSYYTSAGNLVFYNPLEKSVKVLNIYHTIQIPFEIREKWFYIDRNAIRIFRIYGDEEGTSMKEVYRIKINSKGDFNIANYNR